MRVILLLTLFGIAGQSVAASDDECAAWLCATVGFALPECRASHKAMVKRVMKLKSPLPLFSSCGADAAPSGAGLAGLPGVKVKRTHAEFTGRCLAPSSFFVNLTGDFPYIPAGCEEWELSTSRPQYPCTHSARAFDIQISDSKGEKIGENYMFSIYGPKYNGRCGG